MTCNRPLVEVLGDAAYCNVCGAERGEPCRQRGYTYAQSVLRMQAAIAPVETAQLLGDLLAAAWGAVQLIDGDRPAQAASMLRSVLPDDYRPVGA